MRHRSLDSAANSIVLPPGRKIGCAWSVSPCAPPSFVNWVALPPDAGTCHKAPPDLENTIRPSSPHALPYSRLAPLVIVVTRPSPREIVLITPALVTIPIDRPSGEKKHAVAL